MVIIKLLLLDRNEIMRGYIHEISEFDPIHSLEGEDILEFVTTDSIEIEKEFRILYEDDNLEWHEYIVKGIEESGIGKKSERRIFCENSFYETIGDFIEENRSSGTVEHALERALEPTRWTLGIVEVSGDGGMLFYRTSAREAVGRIIERWGGEIRTRIDVTDNKVSRRSLDILYRRGRNLKRRFTYSNGLSDAHRIIIRDDVITALYGFGKGEELENSYGRRIDFSSINDGKMYLENNDAKELWGRLNEYGQKEHRFGKVEFTDIEDPYELKEATQKELDKLSQVKISYEINIKQLRRQGFNGEDLRLGDTIIVVDKGFTPELRVEARIVELRPKPLEHGSYLAILGNFETTILNEFEKQENYVNNAVNTLYEDIGLVRDSASGKNKIFWGVSTPETEIVEGDLWYKPVGDGETEMYIFDGERWELIIDTSETTKNADAIAEQQKEIEDAQQVADEAVEQIDTAVANAGFTSLDETISSVQTISNQAQINAGTAIDNALEAMQQASQAIDNTGSLSVRVDEVENTLSVKADKQTVDDLTGVVDLQALDIQANAQGLALKANQDTVDTLAGTVSSLGTDIGVVAGQINSKVWNTDIETAIDGIEVGGRNLYPNTSSEYEEVTFSGWQQYLHFINIGGDSPLQIGDTITWSGYLEAGDNHVGIMMDFTKVEGGYIQRFSNWIPPGKGGKVIGHTVIPEGVYRVRLAIRHNNGSAPQATHKYKELKIEKGNKATDWTPAPEDTIAKIEHVETEFTQTFDTFSQTVAGIDGRVTSQKQTIDSITQTVTDQTGKIATVEQNVNGIQQTVSDPVNGLVTQVSTLANGFNVLATDFEDLEIGGRNLYLGSSKKWRDATWTNWDILLSYTDIEPNETYTASVKYKDVVSTAGEVGIRIFWYDSAGKQLKQSRNGTGITDGGSGKVYVTDTAPSNATQGRVILRRYTNSGSQSAQYSQVKLEKGTVATDWTPAPEDMATQAQLSVLNDNINMRVSKGELLSQINLEAGRTLIQSDKLYLDAETTVISGTAWMDGAMIKEATIIGAKLVDASISSAKIISLDVNKVSGLTSNFVQSYWNSATGGSVQATGDGIQSTASDGSQVYIQNGIVGARNPNGSSLGHIGYHSETSRTFFHIQTSLGTNFAISARVGTSANTTRKTMLDIFPGSSETYIRTNDFRHIGATGDSSTPFARFYGDVRIDGDITANTSRMDIQRVNWRYGSWIYDSSSNSDFMIVGGGRLRFYTRGASSAGSLEAFRLDNAHGYMYRTLSMEGNPITNSPSVSDGQLKDVQGLRVEKDLEKLMKIEYVNFRWKNEEYGGQDLGFVAQQVQNVIPEIITETANGLLGYNSNTYLNFIGHSVQQLALREQNTNKVASQALVNTETHEEELKRLKNRIEELERKVA